MSPAKGHRTCWFPTFFSRWTLLPADEPIDLPEQVPSLSTVREKEHITNTVRYSSQKTRLDFGNVLEIHVGDEGCFWVPQNRIRQRSGFFRDYCLRLPVGVDEVPVIDLTSEDRFIFDIYLQVVYQDQVILPLHMEEAQDPHWSMTVMIRTYMLADKLKDMESSNIILDGIIEFCFHHEVVFTAEDWRLIFRGKYDGTALRRLAVDRCVLATQPEFLESQLYQMPTEMAKDCIAKFAHARHDMLEHDVDDEASDTTGASLISLDRCKNYHQHSEGSASCPSLSRSGSKSDLEPLTHRHNSPVGSVESLELEVPYPAWNRK